jgi:succinylglutamic semialdehyde dehydrogenase
MSHSELQSINPVTGEIIWAGAITAAGGIDAILQTAKRAQSVWVAANSADRIEVAKRFGELVLLEQDAFARIIANETGKPYWETRTEVATVAAKVAISISAQAERAGQSAHDEGSFTRTLTHRPHGVLAVLGPYNFPAHLPNGHIVPALLAGNAVVFKPSEKTPATAAFMADLWTRAGLPDGVLQLVYGYGDIGAALAGHDGIDGLLFTGSSSTGLKLARQFGETPWKMLALEMGGNNPLVIWEPDARQMDAIAALIVQSSFLSSGQRCTCARRVIVQDAHFDAVTEAVVAVTKRLIIDAPFADPQPFMGPVIDNAAADHLQAGYNHLLSAGGKPILEQHRLVDNKSFLTPAILDMRGAGVSADAELFGPIAQFYSASHFDVAIARANDTRFGLSASLVGGDATHFNRFANEIKAGIINWNRPTNGASSAAPFGGVGLSGNHRPSAFYAADYCAYPVAGVQSEGVTDTIAIGLKD